MSTNMKVESRIFDNLSVPSLSRHCSRERRLCAAPAVVCLDDRATTHVKNGHLSNNLGTHLNRLP
jgi:hypothetical protein